MEYQDGNFTTAGSFELRAYQDGQSLSLGTEKGITVRMVSDDGDDDFDFFRFDEENGKWDSLGTAAPEYNAEKSALEKKIRRLKNKPHKYLVLDYLAVLDVVYNNDLSKPNHARVRSKARAYGLGWASLKNYQSIRMNGSWHFAPMTVWENTAMKRIPSWTRDRLCFIERNEDMNCTLHVFNQDSSRHFQMPLKALMPLNKLFALDPDMWNKDYQQAMAIIRTEEARWKKMNDYYRSFEVLNMGIHNWDRLLKKEADPLFVHADFNFDQEYNPDLYELEAVYFSADKKSMIRLPDESWQRMTIVSEEGGKLFVLLPGEKAAIYTAKQYASIPRARLRQQEDPNFMFKMNISDSKIESEEQLRRLLDI